MLWPTPYAWYIISWDNFWIEFGFPPVTAQRFPG